MEQTVTHQKDNSRGNYHFDSRDYGNKEWPPHFHRGNELVYIAEGEITLTVDNVSERLHGGDFALILSNQIHSYQRPDHVKMKILVFSEQYVPYFTASVKGKRSAGLAFHTDETTKAFVLDGFYNDTGSIMRRKAWLYAICNTYLEQSDLIDRKTKNDRMICELLDYISENFSKDITLKSAAEYFGYEYHYLSRLLSGQYNISFRDTVNLYRVESALALLEQGNIGIAEIAEVSGFQSIRSFNYVFKSVTGKTPREYLK